jgi:chromosome segregation ATPase
MARRTKANLEKQIVGLTQTLQEVSDARDQIVADRTRVMEERNKALDHLASAQNRERALMADLERSQEDIRRAQSRFNELEAKYGGLREGFKILSNSVAARDQN